MSWGYVLIRNYEYPPFFRAGVANLEQKICAEKWRNPSRLFGQERLYGVDKLGQFLVNRSPNKMPIYSVIVVDKSVPHPSRLV
jgi:hypothetical protein